MSNALLQALAELDRARIRTNRRAALALSAVLFVVLVTLKLTGKLDWSWWWVCAPVWVHLAAPFIIVPVLCVVIKLAKAKDPA